MPQRATERQRSFAVTADCPPRTAQRGGPRHGPDAGLEPAVWALWRQGGDRAARGRGGGGRGAGPVTRPGRSPSAAPAPAGPAQPRGPLRSAAPRSAAPPRCGWAPRRCCWPVRCGSPSAPTPSSCSSAAGDTAKGAASRVRRGGAAGRLRLGPGSVSSGAGAWEGPAGGERRVPPVSSLLLALCDPGAPRPLGLPGARVRPRPGLSAGRPGELLPGRTHKLEGAWHRLLPLSKMASQPCSLCFQLLRWFICIFDVCVFVCVLFQDVEDDNKTWFIISSSMEAVLYMGWG